MADEVAATQMVAYFANGTAQLRGRSVYVQFSNHKELKTDQTHSNAVSVAADAAAAVERYRLFSTTAHYMVPVGSSSWTDSSSSRTVVAGRRRGGEEGVRLTTGGHSAWCA